MRGVIKEGGTAFPCHGINGQVFQYGMTLRDWFAGQALAGLCGNADHIDALETAPEACNGMAEHCFKLADAMIAAREGRAE